MDDCRLAETDDSTVAGRGRKRTMGDTGYSSDDEAAKNPKTAIDQTPLLSMLGKKTHQELRLAFCNHVCNGIWRWDIEPLPPDTDGLHWYRDYRFGDDSDEIPEILQLDILPFHHSILRPILSACIWVIQCRRKCTIELDDVLTAVSILGFISVGSTEHDPLMDWTTSSGRRKVTPIELCPSCTQDPIIKRMLCNHDGDMPSSRHIRRMAVQKISCMREEIRHKMNPSLPAPAKELDSDSGHGYFCEESGKDDYNDFDEVLERDESDDETAPDLTAF